MKDANSDKNELHNLEFSIRSVDDWEVPSGVDSSLSAPPSWNFTPKPIWVYKLVPESFSDRLVHQQSFHHRRSNKSSTSIVSTRNCRVEGTLDAFSQVWTSAALKDGSKKRVTREKTRLNWRWGTQDVGKIFVGTCLIKFSLSSYWFTIPWASANFAQMPHFKHVFDTFSETPEISTGRITLVLDASSKGKYNQISVSTPNWRCLSYQRFIQSVPI